MNDYTQASYELHVTRFKVQVTSYQLKVTSYDYTQVAASSALSERERSRIETLQERFTLIKVKVPLVSLLDLTATNNNLYYLNLNL